MAGVIKLPGETVVSVPPTFMLADVALPNNVVEAVTDALADDKFRLRELLDCLLCPAAAAQTELVLSKRANST
jgi:hypothetical protein